MTFVAAASFAAETLPLSWADRLSAMNRLRVAGQFDEARQLGRLALEIANRFPQPDARLAFVYNSLGSLEQDAGNWNLAEMHYTRSLRILDQFPRDQYLEGRAVIQNNFGTLYTKMNRPDRAEPLLRQAVAFQTQLFGNGHPETIRSRMNLAQLLHVMGRQAEAAKSFEELLVSWQSHPEFKIEPMIISNNLAVIAIQQGKLDEAVSRMELILAGLTSVPDTHPLFKARAQTSLGHCYRLRGNLSRAEDLLDQAMTSLGELAGFDHPDYALALSESAQVLRKTGRKALAAKQERQARAIVQRHAAANFLNNSVDVKALAASQ